MSLPHLNQGLRTGAARLPPIASKIRWRTAGRGLRSRDCFEQRRKSFSAEVVGQFELRLFGVVRVLVV